MIRFQTEQTIDRPAHQIWTYAADITRHPEWMGVIDARPGGQSEPRSAPVGCERTKLGPRTFEWAASRSPSRCRPGASPGGWMAGARSIGEVTLDLEPWA